MDHGSLPCAYNYAVTAHKPTSVAHSAVGQFTGPEDVNLILSYVVLPDFQYESTLETYLMELGR